MDEAAENDEIRMTNGEQMPNDEARNKMSILSGRLLSFVPRHLFEASRHSQMQRTAAMMSATQLTPIGMVRVPTVTWACLISRTR